MPACSTEPRREILAFFAPRWILLAALAIASTGATLQADELADLTAKADKGEAEAQFELGRRYQAGTGVAKDEAQALHWFLKAAQRDHAKALVSLGSIYAHGFGVKEDWAESIRWYRLAALQGDRIAQHNLGLDYNHGHGVERDLTEAARWFRLGAEQGQPRCQYNLALLYEAGQGVTQSDLEAFVLQSLAAAHENQLHIFGEAKAQEVIDRREKLLKKLSPGQQTDARQKIAAFQARVPLHPRRFGAPGNDVGLSRGWYIWHSFNPETWEAVVSRDPPEETWKVRVLPWASTYRYLNYGVRPDRLLPGERVNMFFNPDENQRRGYLVHFQDEICQMFGHGHFWQTVAVDGPNFTARVMAGEKPLEEQPREFTLDPQCRKWKDGKLVEQVELTANQRLYLTWCLREGKRVVMLLSDEASLPAIKQQEAERMAAETAKEGVAGRLESLDKHTAHVLIFNTHWSQAGQIKEGQSVRLSATGPGFHPQGETISGTVKFRKNRGQYGSGVTDMLVELALPADVAQIQEWLDERVLRVIPPRP